MLQFHIHVKVHNVFSANGWHPKIWNKNSMNDFLVVWLDECSTSFRLGTKTKIDFFCNLENVLAWDPLVHHWAKSVYKLPIQIMFYFQWELWREFRRKFGNIFDMMKNLSNVFIQLVNEKKNVCVLYIINRNFYWIGVPRPPKQKIVNNWPCNPEKTLVNTNQIDFSKRKKNNSNSYLDRPFSWHSKSDQLRFGIRR